MRPSVIPGVSQRPLTEGQELQVLNDEVRPVLSATRDVVNHESQFKVTDDTSDSLGAFKRIWESDEAPDSGTWFAQADIVGTGAAGLTASYVLRSNFALGTPITLVLNQNGFVGETDASCNARFGIDLAARTIYVEVLDNGTAMRWAAVVRVLEVV